MPQDAVDAGLFARVTIPGVGDVEARAAAFNPPGGLSFSGIFYATLLSAKTSGWGTCSRVVHGGCRSSSGQQHETHAVFVWAIAGIQRESRGH